MRAIAINRFGTAEEFSETEIASPKPSRDEVRIQIKAVGFNPVDFKLRNGEFGDRSFPYVLGAECSGVIDAVGNARGPFSVGDEVYTFAMGPISNGTYAEAITLPASFVAKKPKNLTFAEAAAVPLTYITAFQALIATGALHKDRPFFLAGGSGGVGSSAIALAKVYGAGPVFTTAGSLESRDSLLARFSLDPKHILLYKGLSIDEMRDQLIEMNGGRKFYLSFDCVGQTMKELAFAVTDFYGHIATILREGEGLPSKIFEMSQSLHCTFLGAPALFGGPLDWKVYGVQLAHLTHLFENEGLMPPQIEVVGDFSRETVMRAHHRLEGRHTIGKLVMRF